MALEEFIPTISLTIVSLVAVYVYDWIFIILDNLFGEFVRNILEDFIRWVFNDKFRFKGFWLYVPSFLIFAISIVFVLPWLINLGINNFNPFLEDILNQGGLYFATVIVSTFIILYGLFRQFYYLPKKKESNNPK